jgi:Sulphur transport
MIFPFYSHDLFGYFPGLLIGTLVGVGFGFALERAGFGSARILTAQFYFTNMRVLKVMFSAVATAAVGMALLSGAGLLDLSAITVPETFLGPQLVGGLIFGVGFLVSGYCPGTGVVAMASGHFDALVTLVGMLGGSLIFGFGYDPLERFYKSGAMGVTTLYGALGLPPAVVAAGVVAMAIGAFLGAEKVEVIFCKRTGDPVPAGNTKTRNMVFAGLGATVAAALVLAILPKPTPLAVAKPFERIGPSTLAAQLVGGPEALWLVDTRGDAVPAAGRIAGALALPAGAKGDEFLAQLAPERKLIFYAQKDVAALPGGAKRFGGRVAVLAGGYDAFQASVLTKPAPPAEATTVLLAEYRLKTALFQRFTGVQRAPEPVKIDIKTSAGAGAAPKKGGGC